MMNKLNKTFSILFTTCCIFSSESYAIEINEALTIAYKNNPEIHSALSDLRSADENAPQALSNWLPTIGAEWDRGVNEKRIGTSESNGITDTKSLTLTQPIVNGGRNWFQYSKAKHLILAARENFRKAEQSVLLRAAQAYMDIVRDEEVLNLNKKNMSVLQEHLNVTKERFKLGEVTRTDISQAEANLANAISDKTKAEGQLESSRAAYYSIIGEMPTGTSMPKTPILLQANIDEMVEIAMQSNPSVRIAEYNIEAAKDNVNIYKSSLLPSLSLAAAKDKTTGALVTDGSIETESLQFKIAVPLYQSGAEYSRVRQAKEDKAKLEYDLETTKKDIKESVISAYQDFQVARASISSNESSVSAFETALEGTMQESKVGTRTTLDVLDAERDLFQAQVKLVSSKRDEIVSAYNILAQIGRLSASELALETTEYDLEEHYNDVKYKIIGF